jgi:Tfp pilus assembly protein PilF
MSKAGRHDRGSGVEVIDSATTVGSTWRDRRTVLCLLLMLVGLLFIYHRTFHYPFTDWDDTKYVAENNDLDALSWDQVRLQFTSYAVGNYHPVTMLSYACEISLFGRDPEVMHRTNVIIHAISCLLVFFFLLRVTGDPWVSVLAALLFAWHPLRVESVAWVSGRKDVLMLLFSLLALIAWLDWSRRGRPVMYAAAFLFFVLACLSKAMAVAIVPSMFVVGLLRNEPLLQWRTWREKLPFIITAIVFGVIAVQAQKSGGAMDHELPALRFVVVLANPVFYALQQAVPVGLAAHYGYPEAGDVVPLFIYPLFAAVTLVGLWAWWRRGLPPLVTFCILFFLVNIALVLQIIPVGYAVRADRYTYVAGIGAALLTVILIKALFTRLGRPAWWGGAVLLYAIGSGVLAYQRTEVWSSALNVWDDILATNPKAGSTWMSRGITLKKMGRLDDAMASFDRSVALRPPRQTVPLWHRAMLHMTLGDHGAAANDLGTILREGHNPPGVVPNMVYAKMRAGRCDQVIEDVERYLGHVPGEVDLLNLRAWCLFEQGRASEAIRDVEMSMARDSSYAAIQLLKAMGELAAGGTEAACDRLNRTRGQKIDDELWAGRREELVREHCGGWGGNVTDQDGDGRR